MNEYSGENIIMKKLEDYNFSEYLEKAQYVEYYVIFQKVQDLIDKYFNNYQIS